MCACAYQPVLHSLDFRQATGGGSTPEYVDLSSCEDVEMCKEMDWLVDGSWPHNAKVQLTVPLQPGSIDFEVLKAKVLDTCQGKGVEVADIWRVQNPAVYRKYVSKKDEYMLLYGKCEVKQLYHGTKKQHVQSIVRENLDTRYLGQFGCRYGHGVNFSSISWYASHHCDKSDDKYLLVCNVLVANMLQVPANSVKEKPPLLPFSHTLRYDTTVKNTTKLDVVVKFAKHEFFPTHIVHINVKKENQIKRSLNAEYAHLLQIFREINELYI